MIFVRRVSKTLFFVGNSDEASLMMRMGRKGEGEDKTPLTIYMRTPPPKGKPPVSGGDRGCG